MTPFQLKIATPCGLAYDGQAEALILRATTGDMGFLAGHCDMIAVLGTGRAAVVFDGKKRCAHCSGGTVFVKNGTVTLLPTHFAWLENK
jgi:F-type H+-transporting ATPase subunit epsilon